MTKSIIKKLIIEGVLLVITIILVILVFNINLKIGNIEIVSLSIVMNQESILKNLDNKLSKSKSDYSSSLKSLENAKSNYETQKRSYDAITDETIQMLNTTATSENYNIEYLWIKIGNYAKKNNLKLIMNETGSNITVSSQDELNSSTTTTKDATSSTSQQNSDNLESKSVTSESTSNTSPLGSTTINNASSGNVTLQVVGGYLDTSEFIFDLENDDELKFKITNISMTYAQQNKINTAFTINNVALVK